MVLHEVIFVDTNLNTHLVIGFHHSDTVSFLKDKIIQEHLHCFPQFGDITINAIKVKRRGCFYHLSHSLSLDSVFGFVKNRARFLYVDASTTTTVKELDDPRVHNLIDAITNDGSADVNREKLLLLSSNDDVVHDTRHLKRKREDPGAVAKQLSLDGGVGSDVLKNDEFSGRDAEVKSSDANHDPLVQDKGDICDKEIEIPVTSKINDPDNEVNGYVLGNVTSVPISESVPPTKKKKKKTTKKRKQSVPDLSLKEKELSQDVVPSVVSPDEVVENKNSIGGSGNVARETGLASTDGTAVLRKHVELKTDKSSDLEGHCDKSEEDKTPQEPVAKKRRKDGKYGSKKLSKTDEAVVLESNKETVNPLPVSQHFQEDQQNHKSPTLGSSIGGIPDDVNVHSAHKTSGKKKKKEATKDTLDQGSTLLLTSGKDVQGKSSGLGVDSKNLGDKPDSLLLKEKQKDSVPETDERPSLREINMGDLDASDVGGRHEDCKTEVKVDSKSKKYSEDQPLVDSIKGVEEGQNLSLKISLETSPSEKSKSPSVDELASRDKVVISRKLVEASESMDPLKLSKKRKKSKKSKDLATGTPSASVSEHVKVNGTSLCKSHKAMDANHQDDDDNEEPNMLPTEGKTASEVETSTSFITEKEIGDAIRNGIESVSKIRQSEVSADCRDGKSRKKSTKKQTPDLLESKNVGEKVSNNVPAPSNNIITKEVERLSDISLLGQSSQGQTDKMKSHNEGRCPEAVGNGNFSNNGHSNEGANDLEVSHDSTGINFNDYFVPGQLNQKSVNSGVAHVSGIGKVKDKKNKKKLDSHGISSNVLSSHSFTESQGLGAKSSKFFDSVLKTLPSSRSDKLNSVSGKISNTNAVKPSGSSSNIERKVVAVNSRLESSKDTNLVKKRVIARNPEEKNMGNSKKTPTTNAGVVVNNLQHKKSIIGAADSIFNDALDGPDEESSTEGVSSDDNTRTPSDKSLSSDYSDGDSKADPNLTQNAESQSWRGIKTIRKPLNTSGMSLDEILRSSSRYKKAKLTASQLELEESEMPPAEFVPETESQNP